jgi:hypothetical protein
MKSREDQRKVDLARRLHAVDVPLEINVKGGECGLRMSQCGEEHDSCAFSAKYPGTGYAVYIRITFILPGLAISRFDLELLWRDPSISLLEDPNETKDPYGEYCFPGGTSYGYPRKRVINHCADVTLIRTRGETLDGFLLWAGMNPIPDYWPLWKKIPAFVIVCDQFDVTYECPITLFNTCEKKSSTPERRKSVRRPLFECSESET